MKKKEFIGIDISKKTLDVAIYEPESKKMGCHFTVENDLSGFKVLIKTLTKKKINLDTAFICMEYCGIYGMELGYFLEGKISFCFCNPLHIKRSMGLTRGKNDKVDAFQIAKFCYTFRDNLSPQEMPSLQFRKLKFLISERNGIVKNLVKEKRTLKELKSVMTLDSIKRYSKRLKILEQDKKAVDLEIKSIINSVDDLKNSYNLLTSITGISLVNATMMILCSNNFKGIDNPRSFACYCGVAPFEHTSGTSIKGKTKVSQYANKRMKADLTNAARSAVIHDPEITNYYKRKRDEGKSHGTVMNAVKFKLITRAYAVVQRGTPYVKLKQVC
jgi:transposase